MDTIRALQGVFGVAPGQPWLGITQLGSDLAYIATLVLYFFLAGARPARVVGLFFGVSAFLNAALKDLFREPRPYTLDPSVASSAAVATAGGFAFPSGHAMVTGTLWVLMALQQRSRTLWVVSVVLTALVGFSRVVLGVHFVTDVLVGWLFGVLLALLGAACAPALVRLMHGPPSVRTRAPVSRVAYWLPPVVAGAVAALFSEDWGRSLGIAAGFWLLRTPFEAPKDLARKLVYAVVGLALGVGLYLLSSVALPLEVKRSGLGAFVRYAVLVLLVTEGVPRLLRMGVARAA